MGNPGVKKIGKTFKMRILLITEFFPDEKKQFSGGVETRTFFLAKYLSQKHKIIVISRRKKGEKLSEKNGNIIITRLGRQVAYTEVKFSSIFPRLIFIAQSIIYGLKQKVDLVEGSNFICLIPTFVIAKLKKIPSVAWYPDIYGSQWIKNFGFSGFFGWLLEKIGLVLPWTKVIALSEQTKKKLITQGLKKEKISIIYGGVDVDFIKNIKVKKAKDLTICCISRLLPYKNVDCLVKAINLIKRDIPDVKCFIIGKGPEKERLVNLASELKVAKNIEFKQDLDYQELIKLLKSSHIFCLPSRIEGFGLVTIEALAAQVPFVIADIPINHEVTKGKGGLFFQIGNENNLAKKIIYLLANESGRKKYVNQGKELLDSYNWESISKKTERIFERLLSLQKRFSI